MELTKEIERDRFGFFKCPYDCGCCHRTTGWLKDVPKGYCTVLEEPDKYPCAWAKQRTKDNADDVYIDQVEQLVINAYEDGVGRREIPCKLGIDYTQVDAILSAAVELGQVKSKQGNKPRVKKERRQVFGTSLEEKWFDLFVKGVNRVEIAHRLGISRTTEGRLYNKATTGDPNPVPRKLHVQRRDEIIISMTKDGKTKEEISERTKLKPDTVRALQRRILSKEEQMEYGLIPKYKMSKNEINAKIITLWESGMRNKTEISRTLGIGRNRVKEVLEEANVWR